MHILIGIALKSLLIAGMALGLLQIMKRRSAAERSWIAHIGLLALVIMALAPLVLPSWNVAVPGLADRPVEVAAVPVQPIPAVATVNSSATPIQTATVPKPKLSTVAAEIGRA